MTRPTPPKKHAANESNGTRLDAQADSSISPSIRDAVSFSENKGNQGFSTFAWLLLIYNLAVVAWGVYVRASISGDGCGDHWPLCDGKIIPAFGSVKQVIEFSHRASTGLVLPLALALVVWARRAFPKGSQVRTAAYLVLGFTILEALIGGVLVKFGLVAQNTSPGRATIMSFHVVSTFLLMSSIVVAALLSRANQSISLKGQGVLGGMVGVGFVGIIALGVSGAISALGHTLNPVDDVLRAAANPSSFWMVRLQPYHPYLSAVVGLYLILVAGLLIHLRPSVEVRKASLMMVAAFAFQALLGLINIQLKAPIWMQMVHLVAADIVFISLVLAAVYALLVGAPQRNVDAPVPVNERPHGRELVMQYVALTKPRVISLLLFTTLTSMFAAAGGWPGGWLLLAVAIGGYMSAGAANAINMVIDRDIDGTMKRTSKRPTVTQTIPSSHALLFGLTLGLGAFALLWGAANLLSAALSFTGLVFYVVVYTLLLKRRTWNNIVIGGAAGAFPPLVGWAAVANNLTPLAWYLFAIIFVWTPVHFWALAIMIKDDYAAAGVPMLPVIKGEHKTAVQIALYTALTLAVTLLPVFWGYVGWIYIAPVVVLNLILVKECFRLYRKTDRPNALALYKFSMLYLAILFLVLAFDQRWMYAVL